MTEWSYPPSPELPPPKNIVPAPFAAPTYRLPKDVNDCPAATVKPPFADISPEAVIAVVEILVAVNKLVPDVHVKPVLVVVAPLPLPIISCPAVLEILACFPSNAVCNPVVLAIVNAGIFDSTNFMSILNFGLMDLF